MKKPIFIIAVIIAMSFFVILGFETKTMQRKSIEETEKEMEVISEDVENISEIEVEENNKYNINMKYRLKLNGKYLIGGEDEWVEASSLNKKYTLLETASNDKYSLEWKWFSADNDTAIGKIDDATYGLNISIKFKDSVK